MWDGPEKSRALKQGRAEVSYNAISVQEFP